MSILLVLLTVYMDAVLNWQALKDLVLLHELLKNIVPRRVGPAGLVGVEVGVLGAVVFRWRYCYLGVVLHLGVLVHVGLSRIFFAVEVRQVVLHLPHRFLQLYLGTG